jgi:hypothetical protein
VEFSVYHRWYKNCSIKPDNHLLNQWLVIQPTLSLDAELIRRIRRGSPPWSEISELRLKQE